jgi:hypothetical protein
MHRKKQSSKNFNFCKNTDAKTNVHSKYLEKPMKSIKNVAAMYVEKSLK